MREQPDFSTSPRPRRAPVGEILAVLVGLAVLGGVAAAALAARREAAAAAEQLAAVRTEMHRMESRLEALQGRTSAGGVLLTRAAAAGESPPERIVATLAHVLPDDTRLETLTIRYDDTISLDLRVVARDPRAWDRTLERLVAEKSLEEVVPGPERRDGEIRTGVTARWVERR